MEVELVQHRKKRKNIKWQMVVMKEKREIGRREKRLRYKAMISYKPSLIVVL
jgi:hypothetical protein